MRLSDNEPNLGFFYSQSPVPKGQTKPKEGESGKGCTHWWGGGGGEGIRQFGEVTRGQTLGDG